MNIGNLMKRESRGAAHHRVRQTVKQVRRLAEKEKRKQERAENLAKNKKLQEKLARKAEIEQLKESYRQQLNTN